MKKLLFFFSILLFSLINLAKTDEIKILYKLENEIITNQDLIDELNYLVSLNNNLISLEKNKLNQIAVRSIIKEKIKYLELKKYFKIDENTKEIDDIVLKEINKRLRINSLENIEKHFSLYNLSLEQVKFKIRVELFWNKLIYDRYINKISINRKNLKKKVLNDIENKAFIDEYFLKEILFNLEENENLEKKYLDIKNTIKNTGFENAANIYSVSDTSKFGGEIGWINKLQLSEKITNQLDKIEIGGLTNYIPVGNSYLIIKLDNKRKIKSEINLDEETEILIQKETDRQLNQYSINLFNKLKKNIFIYEL